jgi:hypothetical protein
MSDKAWRLNLVLLGWTALFFALPAAAQQPKVTCATQGGSVVGESPTLDTLP